MSIVAGGYSFKEVDHQKIPHPVIAVNDALLYLECEVDFVVSMDRLWTEARWPIMHERTIPAFLRTAALKRVPYYGCDWVFPFVCDHTTAQFGDTINHLNGSNSGTCALNLAYVMKPTELYLFGFDMQPGPKGQRRWYPLADWEEARGYNGTKGYKFGQWINEMILIRSQFNAISTHVFNVSSRSLITAFEIVTPKQLGWSK
jgi:hypothetical protein